MFKGLVTGLQTDHTVAVNDQGVIHVPGRQTFLLYMSNRHMFPFVHLVVMRICFFVVCFCYGCVLLPVMLSSV